MYRKYGIRVTQDAVTEETKSSNYPEIHETEPVFLRISVPVYKVSH